MTTSSEIQYDRLSPAMLQRVVFLGDSITDGNTYPCLVRDALEAAGVAVTPINAGIGGDTAQGMRQRLERDVLERRPTLVTFSAGANDAYRGVPPEEYTADTRAIIERLIQEQIPLILLTPNMMISEDKERLARLAAYETALRQLAGEYRLRLAEVNRCQRADEARGNVQISPDGTHPHYRGQRMIARAVLDAMGYADLPVPARAKSTLLPGVIPAWKMRPLLVDEPAITAETAAGIAPDAGWTLYPLPEQKPLPAPDEEYWLDDYRQLGMAVQLKETIGGETGRYLGIATLSSAEAHTVYFHTGADLQKIWLNGTLVYENAWTRGWHVGRESVRAALQPGDNTVLIETGGLFFLSVTDDLFWPLP